MIEFGDILLAMVLIVGLLAWIAMNIRGQL